MGPAELTLQNYLHVDAASYEKDDTYQRFWEVDSPDWVSRSNNFPIPSPVVRQELSQIEKIRHPVETVVDFGCSFARGYALFRDKSYIGLDIVEESLERARSLHEDVDFRHIPPSPDGWEMPECDLVWTYTVLVHIRPEHIEAYVAKIKASCKTWMLCETDINRVGHRDPFPNAYCYNRDYHELCKPYRVVELPGPKLKIMSMYLIEGDRK